MEKLSVWKCEEKSKVSGERKTLNQIKIFILSSDVLKAECAYSVYSKKKKLVLNVKRLYCT